jgi:hypothetical protein
VSAVASTRACLLLALAVFAGALALFAENSSFPFTYHPDEPGKVPQVIHRRKNFHHPTAMLTAAGFARRAWLHGEAADDPQRVVELGRRVVAAFAASSAALLAWLAARRYGIWAGLAAGLLVATHPLLYELAHYFKEDPVLLFGIAACAPAAQRLWTRRDERSLALLGAAAGVAAAGKYVGVALVPAAAALGAHRLGRTRRERWRHAAVLAGCALLTWLALDYRVFRSPALLVPQSILEETSKAVLGKRGLVREVPHAFYFDVQDAYGGWWIPALAVLWLAHALWRPRKIAVAEWLLAGVAVSFLTLFSFTPKASPRYYLPIAVALAYLAVAGVFGWAERAGARSQGARLAGTAFAVLLCLAAAWGQGRDTRELRAAFRQDDRAELLQAVAALPPAAIVAQDQAAGLPEPGRRWQDARREPLPQQVFGAKQAPDLGSLAQLRARGVTHLALCESAYGAYFATGQIVKDEASVASRRAFYETALERGRVLRAWKRGRVIPLQPGLVLVDVSEIESPPGVGHLAP